MPREQTDQARRPRREIVVKRDCKLCADQIVIDYKQTEFLRKYMTERGKILPRRHTGNCAFHQRQLTTAIKQARAMLLVR